MNLNEVIKNVGLAKYYLSMPLIEKKIFHTYYSQDEEAFPLKTAHRLLWVTAANLIPHGHWDLAEKMLLHALELATLEAMTIHLDQPEYLEAEVAGDLAHIHANLAQLYADQIGSGAGFREKCLYHARETINTGYFIFWAEELCQRIQQKNQGTTH